MKLDLYKNIKGVDETKQHNKFLLLNNESQLKYEKEILFNWTEGLKDKDKKFVREFQETFHSSFWEMYLYKLFIEAKFELDQSHPMPDFVIKSPIEFYVEAVVAKIKDIGRQESERTLKDQMSMAIPPYLQSDFYQLVDEAIIRASNAVKYKHTKFKNEYINRDWINPSNPFIIAMSSYDQVNYGREYIYPMLALLYGMYFKADTENFVKKDIVIKKETGAEIPLGMFLNNEYDDVSAVIFSCTMTLGKLTSLSISAGNPSFNAVYNIRRDCNTNKYLLHVVDQKHPEDLADGVFIFHNPNAKNKLPENVFEKMAVAQFYYEDGQLSYMGNEIPIISRINTSKALIPVFKGMIEENLRKYNRLRIDDFYDIKCDKEI